MSFIPALLSAGLGFIGQQNSNAATLNAQNQAQQNAANTAANSTAAAKQTQAQGLQQALANLAQFNQSNPSPISQTGAIQAPGSAQGQPAQSFGGGQAGSQAPQMQQRQPMQQMPQQQNLQGAMQGPSPGTNQPTQQAPGQQFQRLQQLYPLVNQMLAGQSSAQPMARSTGGSI